MPSDITEDGVEAERLQLAERLDQLRAAEKLSWEKLGQAVGRPGGTLHQWASGKYPGRIAEISAQVSRFLAAREERARTLQNSAKAPGFVQTPTGNDVVTLLNHAKYTPDLCVITGVPGTSKTSAAKHFAGNTPNTWLVTAMPAYPSPRWMLEEVGRAIGLTESGTSQRLASSIIDWLRGREALLIIDEAQHLATATLDQLRTVHDLAEAGVCLMGNETVFSRLGGGARRTEFAQLFSRVGARLQLRGAKPADAEALLDAWGLQDAEARKLLRTIAGRAGALRSMTKTLRIAHMLAASGDGQVTAAHVTTAWQYLGGTDRDGAA